MVNGSGSCLISGSSLISGYVSGSRLICFELGGSACTALQTAHLVFRLPWGQLLHTKQLRLTLPWGQGVHAAHSRFILP
tara:strand:+ start:5706 stop:5942 length:237 start_codon:yes stop_codon:yes gene_type:complete